MSISGIVLPEYNMSKTKMEATQLTFLQEYCSLVSFPTYLQAREGVLNLGKE